MAVWQEHLHPRDWRGRFVTSGVHVRVSGGLVGVVRDVQPGRLKGDPGTATVELPDGRIGRISTDNITVAEPPRGKAYIGDGSLASVGDTVGHTDTPGKHVIKSINDDGSLTVGDPNSDDNNQDVDPGTLTLDEDTKVESDELNTDTEAERIKVITDTLDRLVGSGGTTEALYFDPISKSWIEERSDMHDALIDKLYTAASDVPNDRKAIMSGGLMGAGKTYTLANHPEIDLSEYLMVNPDDIKSDMFEAGITAPDIGDLSPMEAATLIHEESSYLAMRLAERAYLDGKNVIWDISMSSPGSVGKRIDNLEKNGYETTGVFVSIPATKSAENALSRWRQGAKSYAEGKGFGGRYVPPNLIMDAAEGARSRSKNEDTFTIMRERFTDWELWDNDTGGEPKLVTSKAQTIPEFSIGDIIMDAGTIGTITALYPDVAVYTTGIQLLAAPVSRLEYLKEQF